MNRVIKVLIDFLKINIEEKNAKYASMKQLLKNDVHETIKKLTKWTDGHSIFTELKSAILNTRKPLTPQQLATKATESTVLNRFEKINMTLFRNQN